jgi:predicted sulfurtransferase
MTQFQTEFVRCIPASMDMEWKQSVTASNCSPFIDMKIKIAKELVGWLGNNSASQDINEDGKVSHLSPTEFHEILVNASSSTSSSASSSASSSSNTPTVHRDDLVILDMRNHQETSLGHFEHAKLPRAKNMPDLGRFLKEEASNIANKTVLMYCTGGIRCEKASLYLNAMSQGSAKHIYQLKGGIHQYLEQYSEDPSCQFIGKNFVFYKRGFCGQGRTTTAPNTPAAPEASKTPVLSKKRKHPELGEEANTDKRTSPVAVGLCQECQEQEPELLGCAVCVVCRFQLLLCHQCLHTHGGEHFCFSHQRLKGCYSKFCIPTFTVEELLRRVALLKEKEKELLPEGRKGRARRRTIRTCYCAMEQRVAELRSGGDGTGGTAGGSVGGPDGNGGGSGQEMSFCRSSGKRLTDCQGDCWGYWGKNNSDLEKEKTKGDGVL